MSQAPHHVYCSFLFSKRSTIYRFLLSHMGDEDKFQLMGKLCQEVWQLCMIRTGKDAVGLSTLGKTVLVWEISPIYLGLHWSRAVSLLSNALWTPAASELASECTHNILVGRQAAQSRYFTLFSKNCAIFLDCCHFLNGSPTHPPKQAEFCPFQGSALQPIQY